MWSLARPAHTAEDSFSICISRIRNPDLRHRLEGVLEDIVEASNEYDDAATQAQLHLIAPANGIHGQVTTDEMVKLYTGRMVPKDSPGRQIYDAIIALAKHGRCPFCGHRVVATLDHLLAKAQHPALTVTPNNLAPCCSDCNKAKLDQEITAAVNQYLHPYFDAIEDDLWLTAEVVQSAPASLRFFVDSHDGWSPLISERVENHFSRLGLAKLYSSQAAEELVNIRFQVSALFDRAGAPAVRQFLEETHVSRSAARTNSWQAAFYRALSVSAWYCNGGFA